MRRCFSIPQGFLVPKLAIRSSTTIPHPCSPLTPFLACPASRKIVRLTSVPSLRAGGGTAGDVLIGQIPCSSRGQRYSR